MNEYESRAWLYLFNEREASKNLTPEEILLVDDFGISLELIAALNADPKNPLVNFHLNRARYIINYFVDNDNNSVVE